MRLTRIRGWLRAAPMAEVGRRHLLVSLGALVLVVGTSLPALAQPGDTGPGAQVTSPPKYRMPKVLPAQFTSFAGDSIRAWARSAVPQARDRAALFASIQSLFRMNARFADRVMKIYPRNQLEWLVITDRADDSLAVRLGPVLEAYSKAYPEELLTAGRIAFEDRIARIVGPPDRMLGLHFVVLASYALAQADTLLTFGQVADIAGVQDGALRSMQDWVQLYHQVHNDVLSRHASHLNEEDWILLRLEDNCGNKGADVWAMKEAYVARIGVDSTKTPPEEQFGHEYTIASRKCPGDQRVVYLDMPLFQEVQKEIYRRSNEPKAQEGSKKPK
jgi:hypothetical protein